MFNQLHQHLLNQIQAANLSEHVEIIPLPNNGHNKIGQYRNELIKLASGTHVVFIDDDDWVADTYVQDIVDCINESNPDVITFNGWMTTDDKSRVDFVLRLGEKYEDRNGLYYRYPNHLCPIKREIAVRVPFKNITHQEDYQWATELRDKKLLRTEAYINKQLYHYRFKTVK